MKNSIIRLTPFEVGYLIGMTNKDKNMPRELWLKMHIAACESYLEHPKFGEQAKKDISRYKHELAELSEAKPELNNRTEPFPSPKEPMWRTKDGREMPVRLMTDEHIIRSIALLQRRAVENIVFDESRLTVQDLLKKTKIHLLLEEAKKRKLQINTFVV